jgi:ankyrin repeat protein
MKTHAFCITPSSNISQYHRRRERRHRATIFHPPSSILHLPSCIFAFLLSTGLAALAGTNDPTAALQKGLFEEEANHNLTAAIQEYQAVITRFDQDRKIAGTAVFRLGECYRKQGNTNEANAQFQRIVREFPDQTELVALSRTYLLASGRAGAPESAGVVAPTSDEAEEVRRIRAMIKDSPDLINAVDSQSGNTPLYAAATKGQLTVAEFLLANGANVDAKAQNGWTPLQAAAIKGHKAIVELLLTYKANIQAADAVGSTALVLAAEHGFKNVVEVLLAHGADVNAQTTSGDSPLMMASINGFNSVAALLLSSGADPNAQGWYNVENWGNGQYKPGRSGVRSVQEHFGTALHIAAQRGDLALSQILLTNKASVNATNDSGQTPLGAAAQNGRLAEAELLLTHGADANAKSADPGMQGWTPLHFGVLAQRRDIVALLLKNKADPNARIESSSGVWGGWPKGATPLLLACYNNKSTDIVNLLLEAHADPNLADDNGSTPICSTLGAGATSNTSEFPRILKLLLDHGANVNATDSLGRTSLMLAAQQRDKASLEVLLSFKADVNARSKSGASALHFLIEGPSSQANYPPPPPDQPIPGSWQPVPGTQPRVIRMPRPSGGSQPGWSPDLPDMVAALLNAGAEVNLQDDTGKTPLNYVPLRLVSTEAEVASTWAKIDQLLRQHGAVEDLPDFSSIRITRAGYPQPWVVFQADTNRLNHFTVMETIQNFYGDQARIFAKPPLRFPDFSRVKILKPVPGKPGERKEITLNLLTSSDQFDCAKDAPLDFGDVLEIPEREHPLSEPPVGITLAQHDELSVCLTRHVTFRVKGQPTEITLNGATSGTYLSTALSLGAVQKILRSSSDFANITVKRPTSGTGGVKDIARSVLPFWNKKEPLQNDLWLREGDVVEVPDRP